MTELTLAQLCRALDARMVNTDDIAPTQACPTCGRQVTVDTEARARLCLICTEREVGEALPELADRVSRGMTRKAYLSLPRDDDGKPILPTLTYRQWRDLIG